jgi:stage II sporulation protein D
VSHLRDSQNPITTRPLTLAISSGALIIVLLVTAAVTFPHGPAGKPIPQIPMPGAPPSVGPRTPPADLAKRFSREPVISVHIDAEGRTAYMPLEEYVAGVLGGEVDAGFPLEALAAQAIVARTAVLRSIVEQGAPYTLHRTDACTSPSHFQAYNPARVTTDMKLAVQSTRGQVLLYRDSLANAIFHSCCGGRTADVKESFPAFAGERAYLLSVVCPCGDFAPAGKYTWVAKVPVWPLAALTGRPLWEVATVGITATGPSGRATTLQSAGRSFHGVDFRWTYGVNTVKSTFFTSISRVGDYLYVSGRGWGNGVGLCQWGGYTLARRGWKAAAIIRHYYQGVDVISLWR